MRIRKAELRDLPRMASLEEECFGPERFSRNVLQAFIVRDDAFALLAVEGGEVVGTALCLCPRGRREGRVASVSVSGTQRRKGIGSALLGEAEAQLRRRGARVFELEVEMFNRPAIGLYLKHGYAVAGIIREYYGPGRHAYVMEKTLPPEGDKVKVRIS